MSKKVFILFFFSLLAGVMIIGKPAQAQAPATPIISNVIEEPLTVNGTTTRETEVLIYLDGQYVGLAENKKSENNYDEFSFQEQIDLADGIHGVMAVARDRTSLVLSAPSAEIKFNIGPVPGPTLIAPQDGAFMSGPKPLIKGLTVSNTFVRIYIDGIYNGQTRVVSHPSGTASFAYKPFLNLALGWHTLWAVAENNLGEKSRATAAINFKVEPPMPAPTLFKPVVNQKTTASRPFIVGLAKNNSTIKVYVDQKIVGEFDVVNHKSGTASFAYQAPAGLTKGRHLVYTTATDNRGKESIFSNRVSFIVRQPSIAESAQVDNADAVAAIGEAQAGKDSAVISAASGQVEEKKKNDSDVDKIINEGITTREDQSGSVNEDKQFLSKTRLNLLIFILFILAVIGWMFWVNRELIKERREQNQAGKDGNKDSQDQQNKLL